MAKGFITVPEEEFILFFKVGTLQITAGIPEGAVYKGVYVDVSKKEFVFIFEHESIQPLSGKVSKIPWKIRSGK
jgi:hypothetical protein